MMPEINNQDFHTQLLKLTGQSNMGAMSNAGRLGNIINLTNNINTKSINHDYTSDVSHLELSKLAHDYFSSKGYVISVTSMLDVRCIKYGPVITSVDFDLIGKRIHIDGSGDPDELDAVIAWADSIFTTKFRKVSTAKGIDRDGDLIIKTATVPYTTQTRSTIPSFYPWLTVTPEEYFDAFMAADEPVLIMFGDPGTGKSSFIRHLLEHTNANALLAFNQDVVDKPVVIDTFYERDYDILIYEDLDDQLGKREKGNRLMPTILNGVDGVLKQSRRKKIVFSTNLTSADSIDDALKRMGRCFDIMQFTKLTVPQAEQVLSDMGRPVKDFTSKPKWSLAEITAKHSSAQQVTNRFGRTSGF